MKLKDCLSCTSFQKWHGAKRARKMHSRNHPSIYANYHLIVPGKYPMLHKGKKP